MEAKLVLLPETEGSQYGAVVPIPNGLSVGYWATHSDGHIHITLISDVDTIVHEVATREAVRAELRAANKVAKGEEKQPVIEYDPVTRKFRQVK